MLILVSASALAVVRLLIAVVAIMTTFGQVTSALHPLGALFVLVLAAVRIRRDLGHGRRLRPIVRA